MSTSLGKVLTGAAAAAALLCANASAVQAAPAPLSSDGFWAGTCQAGRACIEASTPPPYKWWNFDGCYFHTFYLLPSKGTAHGNAFRVTYQDDKWDDVEPWTTRWLDARNETKYVYVYC
ncbi:hypothetical protein [Lentzea aerocolonigenes]|uniref:hypothetical protein n=1 Tax=Lentzea aerocolonigenes TaxID=68170 RepID=UPI0005ECF327|nr:hypothetical protein [Lentzea aerocolonigenes]